MSKIESYQVFVSVGAKGGKTLAIELGNKGVKTALIERSAEMIGGSQEGLAFTSAWHLQFTRRVVWFNSYLQWKLALQELERAMRTVIQIETGGLR